MVLHKPFRPSLVSGAPEADVSRTPYNLALLQQLVVPLVLQAPAMDNIYTSRKPLHVPLNISFWVHALYACYAKPNVCECDPHAAKTILVKYNIFHIDQSEASGRSKRMSIEFQKMVYSIDGIMKSNQPHVLCIVFIIL
uniref:Uncharacterized protein n=1 Tax=Oryza rufipogon TaxID=4529 RepID=A0A0E0NZK0_ORYRU